MKKKSSLHEKKVLQVFENIVDKMAIIEYALLINQSKIKPEVMDVNAVRKAEIDVLIVEPAQDWWISVNPF